jgi:hypothetical protein
LGILHPKAAPVTFPVPVALSVTLTKALVPDIQRYPPAVLVCGFDPATIVCWTGKPVPHVPALPALFAADWNVKDTGEKL